MIRQGDVYWAETTNPYGSSPAFRRSYVVIQNNVLNASRIHTVLTCALTTNLRQATAPGNILLDPREANLSERSVVNVSQVVTFDKAQLEELIGTLSTRRMREIVKGINLLMEPREPGSD